MLKPGGILLCGLDNGINFLVSDDERQIVNTLPFNPLKNPEQMKQLTDTDSGVQFPIPWRNRLGDSLRLDLCSPISMRIPTEKVTSMSAGFPPF